MPIPEWYQPIPDADAAAFSEAVDQQLALAQTEYDPTGIFAQRCESNWTFKASQDTRSDSKLPAMYKNEITTLLGDASIEDGRMTVAIGVGEGDEPASLDRYTTQRDEDLPMVVALLGSITGIELAELETRPHQALQALGSAALSFERHFAQKTLELPDTPGDAINLTYFKISGMIGQTEIRFARQVSLPEGDFVYNQGIVCDDRDPGTLYYYPRAFAITSGHKMPMGSDYYNTHLEVPRLELVDRPMPNEVMLQVFEETLRQAGNMFVDGIDDTTIRELASSPLKPEYRLQGL